MLQLNLALYIFQGATALFPTPAGVGKRRAPMRRPKYTRFCGFRQNATAAGNACETSRLFCLFVCFTAAVQPIYNARCI